MTDIPLKRDRRIERTHQLLSQALMDLIIERGYEPLTIQDITDRANVSRTTFYLHFKDKDQLLFASMTKIYDGLVSGNGGFVPMDTTEEDYEATFCDSSDFEHVAEYADFYRMMISRKGSVEFIMRVLSYLAEAVKPMLEKKLEDGEPKVPLDFMAAFFAGAQVGVMKWWLENDLRYSAEDMARMQFFLSLWGIRWALGKEEKTNKGKSQ